MKRVGVLVLTLVCALSFTACENGYDKAIRESKEAAREAKQKADEMRTKRDALEDICNEYKRTAGD